VKREIAIFYAEAILHFYHITLSNYFNQLCPQIRKFFQLADLTRNSLGRTGWNAFMIAARDKLTELGKITGEMHFTKHIFILDI
jgi:hypothetical protein